AAIWFLVRRSAPAASPIQPGPAPRLVPAPPVASYDVDGTTATVSFDVPLPDGEIDDALRELLIREAIEVVRDKRRRSPIDSIRRVVAMGRRGAGWQEVGSVSLETPGQLPPLTAPFSLPGFSAGRTFDPFETMAAGPEHAPGLASRTGSDTLGPLAAELHIPASLQAGLRSQGIDPAGADAGALVIGILRLTGSTVTQKSDDTYEALAAGYRTLIRVVAHHESDHPELGDDEVRRFAADFATSRADRAMLITEKYAPFEVYDRERRDRRARYVTRERIQHFIDALALG
ncbi:MAG: hypothetical protein KKE89_04780, partial [Actinobacteria bacterium]|nr:hypothetical protein [Actinomycetota bacterium]